MKRKTEYIMTEEEAIAIKKITGSINDIDFQEKFKLTALQMELVKNMYDEIPFENDD